MYIAGVVLQQNILAQGVNNNIHRLSHALHQGRTWIIGYTEALKTLKANGLGGKAPTLM